MSDYAYCSKCGKENSLLTPYYRCYRCGFKEKKYGKSNKYEREQRKMIEEIINLFVVEQTFGKLDNMVSKIGNDGRERARFKGQKGKAIINMLLLGFDNETQGQSKADWIKENASDFDMVIDDNPNICKSVVENYLPRRNCGKCNKILTIESVSGYEMTDGGVDISYVICRNENCQKECDNFWKVADVRESYNNEDEYWDSEVDYTHYPTVIRKMNKPPITVLAPYYPAVENQHDERVLLVKNEASDLKKEDFGG